MHVRILFTLCFCIFSIAYSFPLAWDKSNISPSNRNAITIVQDADGIIVEFKTIDAWPYILIKPMGQKSWDLSSYEIISFQIENLNPAAQCEISFHAGMWGKAYMGSAVLRAGEKRRISFRLNPEAPSAFSPLFEAKRMPPGFKGPVNVNTSAIECIQLICSYPIYNKFRISDIEVDGKADQQTYLSSPEAFFPLVNRYGQNCHENWDGKINSDSDLKTAFQKEKAELLPAISSWNKWGGWENGPQLKASGFFRTEKYMEKWYLVDPDGKLFFSRGINAVNNSDWTQGKGREKLFAIKSSRSDGGFTFYTDSMKIKYPEGEMSFFNFQAERLSSWGFNTTGNWSDERLYKLHRHPYTINLPLPSAPIIKIGTKGLRDVFSKEFTEGMQDIFGEKYAFVKNDPYCLGIFIGNELGFGKSTEIGESSFCAAPEMPAKQELVKDLEDKYKTIEDLNKAWGSTYSSWNDLKNSNLKPDIKKAEKDFDAFGKKYVDLFFRTCRDAIKRQSPNTLYLGSRLYCGNDYFHPYVNIAASRYCDVLSYNLYQMSYDRFAPRGLDTDKPVIITESTVGHSAHGSFGSLTNPGVGNAVREETLARQMESAFRHPQIVGIHHFAFKDQPLTGRWDGENYGLGLVDVTDTPYSDFLKKNRAMSEIMYEFRLKSPKAIFTEKREKEETSIDQNGSEFQ